MKHYPQTIYEYRMLPIEGKELFKIVRYKLLLLGPKETDKRLVNSHTMPKYKGIGKLDAENILYQLGKK